MSSNTFHRDIRTRPRHQVIKALKDAGVTQASIARRFGITQTYVSAIIARRAPVRPSPMSKAVWAAIEEAVASNGQRRAS